MAITKGTVLKTMFLPGIWPRFKQLTGSGFSHLSYIMAVVFNTVRILPSSHPYLQPSNFGTYSTRQAIVAAANNIQASRKNIDQVIIFFSIIAALIIMVMQVILLILALIIGQARAADQPDTIAGFFNTPNPEYDIAFRFLDLVFGIPEFFGSKELQPNAGGEYAISSIHQALHTMLEFYSFGILLVGVIIILYMVVTIVAETAQSGIPFGQRLNKSWAGVRLILFFGLIIPVSYGLNASQYLVLTSAKLGSGLASTGWVLFNTSLDEANSTLTGSAAQNIAHPNPADLNHLPGFMMMARACKYSYEGLYTEAPDETETDAASINNINLFRQTWDPETDEGGIQAWAVIKQSVTSGEGEEATTSEEYVATLLTSTTFQNLSSDSLGNDIRIVFGVKDEEDFKNFNAGVAPYCGEMVMRVTDVSEPGSAIIHTAYFDLIKRLWSSDILDIQEYAKAYYDRYVNIEPIDNAPLPPSNYGEQWTKYLDTYLTVGEPNDDGEVQPSIIDRAVEAQRDIDNWRMDSDSGGEDGDAADGEGDTPGMSDFGWAGAGIWYNRIAQQNGVLVSAIQQVPVAFLYPKILENVARQRQIENRNIDNRLRFTPYYASGSAPANYEIPDEETKIVQALNNIYVFWYDQNIEERDGELTGNPFIDTINVLFGSEGLFQICKNTDVHPLAQLSVLGKSLLDRSISSFAMAGAFSVVSILPSFTASAGAASSFFGTVAGVGFLIGFMLFYVLPFLPFLYFFFAVGNWVKGIFEAVVAMPLWALAHLRIDGEGIPGDAAIGGYFLIFEIFIRPILIVVGLIAAASIFAVMIRVLNDIFFLAATNVAGHNPDAQLSCFQDGDNATAGQSAVNAAANAQLQSVFRGPVDEFFFTVLYTILVYMIGTTCFKLIDGIPNQILTRWMAADAPSFSDGAEDSAAGLMKYIAIGGGKFGSQFGESVASLGGGVKQSVQQFMTQR